MSGNDGCGRSPHAFSEPSSAKRASAGSSGRYGRRI